MPFPDFLPRDQCISRNLSASQLRKPMLQYFYYRHLVFYWHILNRIQRLLDGEGLFYIHIFAPILQYCIISC